jgi:hypothetical protein
VMSAVVLDETWCSSFSVLPCRWPHTLNPPHCFVCGIRIALRMTSANQPNESSDTATALCSVRVHLC